MATKAINFFIDKITNSIELVSTGESFPTTVLPVNAEEIRKIYKKDGWQFNWKKEFNIPRHILYKLVIKGDHVIQGLLSLETMDDYIEMNLLENAPHNIGRDKKYLGVAGNLVAFACKESFDAGFQGCLAFTAKTRLVKHYVKTLGARLIYGRERMGIFTDSARKLVNSYYENYFNKE